jgi:single-strand DNA-binding protein
MNNSILIGRLARDPELRRTGTGKAVTSFTVAVDNFGKDSGASFIPCVAWEQKGEFVNNYFLKGSQIAVRGRLQSRQYETKDGRKQTAIELVVDEVDFCGKKEEKGDGYSGGEPAYQQPSFTPIDGGDEELPF